VQDPEIAVTANGHVYVTYDATVKQGNSSYDALFYNKSTDCGATFSPSRQLTTFNRFTYVDPVRRPAGTGAGRRGGQRGEDETDAPAGTRRDCGELHRRRVASGYTYPRRATLPRARQQTSSRLPPMRTVYVVFEQTIPGRKRPPATTFGPLSPGRAARAASTS
jgi:hypothetical protein